MRPNTKEFFYNLFFPTCIVIVVAVLCFQNYAPETMLSGWDTLHPEFDFPLAFKRAISGVWREEQGLGALAGHSHMADLPRIFLLWVVSFVFPVSFLRYFYIFLTLIIGSLGVFVFVKHILGKETRFGQVGAFVASLYYILNFGTLQHYYVPFEMFPTQFAFLPWLFFLIIKYLKEGKTKTLLFFFAVSLLATPMAYAATLFYAYFLAVCMILASYILLHKERMTSIKRGIVVITAIVSVNSFWLLPNIYTVSYQSEAISNSKINSLFSPEAFLHNKAYGDLKDVVIHKNHLFNWREFDTPKSEFVELFDEWSVHLDSPYVSFVAYAIAFCAFVGIVLGLVRRQKFALVILPSTLIFMFFLINENPPLGGVYSLLRESAPILNEALRFPFTKFSIIFIFFLSCYLSYFVSSLISFSSKIKLDKLFAAVFGVGFLAGLVWVMKPAFQGNFISSSMKNDIPKEYFELKEFLDNEPEGIIAKFPMHTQFGWSYYDWDYEGGGPSFMPFLYKQPLLERDYDRWSAYNETFYNEASWALYQFDPELLANVFRKYNVSYVLIDESVIGTGGDKGFLIFDETKEVLSQIPEIRPLEQVGFLSLYKFEGGNAKIWEPDSYTFLDADTKYTADDLVYRKYGNYVSGKNAANLPFVNFDKRTSQKIYTDEETSEKVFEYQHNGSQEVRKLSVPNYLEAESHLPLEIFTENFDDGVFSLVFRLSLPRIIVDGKEVFNQQEETVYQVRFSGSDPPGYISIGDDVFKLELSTNSREFVGNSLVLKGEPLRIGFYSLEPVAQEPNDDFFNEQARFCSDFEQKVVSDKSVANGFILNVGKESVCLGDTFQISDDSIVKLSFKSSSAESIFPQVCMSQEEQTCLSSKLPGAFVGLSDGGTKAFEFLSTVTQGNLWVDFVGQGKEESEGSISYTDINIQSYTLVGSDSITLDTSYAEKVKGLVIDINEKVERIEVRVPIQKVYKEDFELGRGHPEANNCDALKNGRVIKNNLGEIGVTYEAYDNAASCDYYDYPQLDQSVGYILEVEGVNGAGRGLKIYLFDKSTGRADVEELLPEGEYRVDFPVIPKAKSGLGYTLNTESRAFSDIAAKNTLSGISFVAYPSRWMSEISILTSELAAGPVENQLDISGFESNGSTYKVHISGSGLLVLSQGYDDGWKAYTTSSSQNSVIRKIKNSLPFLFGDKLEHVEVNGWANGWIVDSGALNQLSDGFDTKSQNQVVIVYWPQYLQWLGLIILFAAFMSIGYKSIKKGKKEIGGESYA